MKRQGAEFTAAIDSDSILYRESTAEVIEDVAVAGEPLHVTVDLRGQKIVPNLGGTPRGKGRNTKNRKHPMWALLDPLSLARLRLTPTETRVMFTVMARVTLEENVARISQVEIALELGTTSPAVSRAMNGLLERRIIFKERNGVWRINRWLSFRGAVETWEEQTGLDPEPIWDAELVSA